MVRLAFAAAVVLGSGIIGGAVEASDQVLDPGFGSGGVLILDSEATVEAEPVLAPTDDGFVIAWRCRLDDGKDDWCVSHRAPDGSAVAGWGTDQRGIDSLTVIDFGNNNTVRSLGHDSVGRTLLGGHCVVGTSADICAARLDTAGALDPGFDTDGLVRFDAPGRGRKENIFAAAVVGDEIVIGGGCADTTTWDACLLRLDANGGRSTSFSGDGFVANRHGVHQSYVRDLVVHPDGSMTAAVACFPQVSTNPDLCLSRLDADGVPISGFGAGGLVTVDFGYRDQARAVEILSDGTSVIVGSCESSTGDWDTCVATIDTSGSITGSHRIVLAGNQEMRGSATAITETGKLMVAATCDSGASTTLCIMRLDLAGALDPTFDDDGVMVIDPTADAELAGLSLVVLPDGFMATAYRDSNQDAAIVVKVLDPTIVPPTTTTSTTSSTTTSTTTTPSTTTTTTSGSSTSSSSTVVPAPPTTTLTAAPAHAESTTTTPTEPLAVGNVAGVPVGSAVATAGGRPIEVSSETRISGATKVVELTAAGTVSTFELPTRQDGDDRIVAGQGGGVTASGFAPRTPVAVDLGTVVDGSTTVLVESTADDAGAISSSFEIPDDLRSGGYVLTLRGQTERGSQLAISLGVSVSGREIVTGRLPSTGGAPSSAVAILAVAVGAVIVMIRRQPTG